MIFFGVWNDNEISLPPNMIFLSTYAKKMNEIARQTVFKDFFDSLPTKNLDKNDFSEIEEC